VYRWESLEGALKERWCRVRVLETYSRINDMLVACVVVDVDCDAAQRRDFGGQLVEARVVLSGSGKSRGEGYAGGEAYCSRS
jgi:hypothetical protein